MQPVLIIGAGPVGLTMAAELARYRVPVRIIDRSRTPTQTSKALVLWSRTLELMDRMGCTPAFLDAGLRAHNATMRSGRRVLGQVSFDNIASPYAFAPMIPQADTERLLTSKPSASPSSAKPNCAILPNSRIICPQRYATPRRTKKRRATNRCKPLG